MTPSARLDRIEEKREALLASVNAMSEEVRTTQPAPEKWSIGEIVEHLVLAEEAVLDSGRVARRGDRRLRDRVLYLVVMGILRFDIPVRAPSRSMLPHGTVGLDELAERWRSSHRSLRTRLDAGAGKLAGTPFAHPVSGPMTLAQALHMLEVHLDRHTRQIEAIGAKG